LISWYYIFTNVIPRGKNVKGEGGEGVGGWRSGPAGLEVGGKEKIIANCGFKSKETGVRRSSKPEANSSQEKAIR